MKWLFSWGFLLFITCLLSGQEPIKDSLLLLAEATTDPEEQVSIYNLLAAELRNKQPDTAQMYVENALELARSGGFKKQEVRALHTLGVLTHNKGMYREAIDLFHQGLNLRRTFGDSLGVADDYQGLGNSHRRLGELSKALSYQLRCLELRKKYGGSLKKVAYALTNIGNIYYSNEEFEKAIEKYEEAIPHYRKLGSLYDMGLLYNNLFASHYAQGAYEKGLPYLEEALAINDSLGNVIQTAVNLANLAEVYIQLERHDEAFPKAARAIALFESIQDETYIQPALVIMGKLHRHRNNHEEAIAHLERALGYALKKNHLDQIHEIYRVLSETYAERENYQAALEAQKLAESYKDSLDAMASRRELNEIKTQYETEQIERENDLLLLDQARRKRTTRLLIFGVVGLILLVLISLWALRQRKQAYQSLQLQKNATESLLEEKGQLLEDLKTTQLHLLQSEKMASIGQLTAGIAHELNNPIGFVSTNAVALKQDVVELRQLINQVRQLKQNPSPEAMEKTIEVYKELDVEFLDQELVELVESIIRGTERTRDIVTSLRTFSRNTTEEFVPSDIHEGLESTLTILNSQLEVDVQVHKEYGQIPMVRGQITKLNQVFLNILNNAIQALKGKGEIFIKTWSENEETVIISIRDTGTGMTKAVQKRIFEPFFTTKDIGEGTGLGLSISYSIIEQHGGRIEVQSEPEQGTEFRIILPINK